MVYNFMRDKIIQIITESMAADDRETAGAKALVAMVLALLGRNIPVPVPKGLMNCEPTFSMGSVRNISNSCSMNWWLTHSWSMSWAQQVPKTMKN